MLWGIITPLTIYGVWPVLLTTPLCGNHNQFTMLYFALSSLYFHHTFNPGFFYLLLSYAWDRKDKNDTKF